MDNLHKPAESTVYPMCVHKATARRLTTAARGLRLHTAGPWTGGDGPAARLHLR